jgi:carbamoyltransferase
MLSVVRVRQDKLREIPAVCHIDGTSRIQTIDARYQGGLKNLLTEFYEQTAVPLLLNTSLNAKGEPIVESPADAVNCLIGCEIDVLYMGSWRITKSVSLVHTQEDNWLNVTPEVSPFITLTKRDFSVNGELAPKSCSVAKGAGYELQLVDLQFRLLGLVNGKRTLVEIYDGLRHSAACDKSVFRNTVEDLARNGVLRFKLRRQDVT